MPRNWKRSTNKASWSSEALEKALRLVSEGKSIRFAAKTSGIPFSTLFDRISKKNYNLPSLGRHAVLSPDQESAFTKHLTLLCNVFFGLTPVEVRRAAFEYAEKNCIKHNFCKGSRIAGKDWFYSFIKRNPNVSIRKPESTSIGRIRGFNKVEVNRFFNNLEIVFEKFHFSPENIWNMDETGISTVQEPGVVVAPKGQKRVGSVTSWERGKNITVVCCMSAAGQYVPPMFIYPRARMSPLLERDGPPGSIYACSKSGWTNEDLFIVWLKHFIKIIKASKENPVLLVIDNHTSHITLEAYSIFKENGIVVVSLPPHTSHKLQPLDVTVYSPLKAAFNRECDLFIKGKNLEKITPYDVAGLFTKAYGNIATISKAISGFKTTGIHPLDPNVFSDEEFVADAVFSAQQICNQTQSIEHPTNTSISSNNVASPGTSFEEILPIPSSSHDKPSVKKGRAKQHSEIVTSTPMKVVLEEKKRKKDEKGEKSKKKIKINKGKSLVKPVQCKPKKVRKNLMDEFDSTSDEECYNEAQLCDDNECDDIDPGQEKCFICDEFGQDGEMWYRCTSCGIWVHEECSGWDSPEGYACDLCVKQK